jgi:hypothetical protein
MTFKTGYQVVHQFTNPTRTGEDIVSNLFFAVLQSVADFSTSAAASAALIYNLVNEPPISIETEG